LRITVGILFALPLLLWGCGEPSVDRATAKSRYLAAKNECIARYPDSLTEQSDCRTRAADRYIRPTYRYGDLMTRAQEQRRDLAERADRHEISRQAYNREVARSEAAISREEDRRNARRVAKDDDEGLLDPLVDSIAGIFH
jgi:hypothetical protein